MDKSSSMILKDSLISYTFLKLCLLLVFLKSLHAWFTWDLNIVIVNAVAIVSFVIYLLNNHKAFLFSDRNLLLCFLFFSVKIYSVKNGNIYGFIGAIASSILISYLICIKDEYKIDILYFITKAISILLLLSLMAWLLFLLGVSLPYFKTDFNEGQYYFNNHYFFLYNINSMYSLFLPRFSSVFLEPGQLGMITALLLFIHKFKLKIKEVLVVFIATIFTFSLAAYILSIFSIIAIVLINTKKYVIHTIILFLMLFLTYSFFAEYNNGDNIINTLIIERLKYSDGDIAGNNRVTEYLDRYYDQFIQSEDNLLGIGGVEFSNIDRGGEGNAGYKRFLIENGIIGLFIVFIFYFYLSLKYKSKLTFSFLILYILIFVQASYPLWECMLIIYITALPLIRKNSFKEIE